MSLNDTPIFTEGCTFFFLFGPACDANSTLTPSHPLTADS